MIGLVPVAVGGSELDAFCHSPEQCRVLAMPGAPVRFFQSFFETLRHPTTSLARHVNALLVQSRGALRPSGPCACCKRLGRDKPFFHCHVVEGAFEGSCGNCLWFGRPIVCADDIENEDDEHFGIFVGEEFYGDAEENARARPAAAGGSAENTAEGSWENPVVL